MASVDEHRDRVARLLDEHLPDLGPDPSPLPVSTASMAADPARYAHRVLAADVLAPLALPPFANSQMDGYAVRADDLAGASALSAARLPVAAPIPAGTSPAPLAPGTAAAVMTGAPIPAGADAVVPVERVDPSVFASEGETVSFPQAVDRGTFVRSAGSDVAAGDVLLPAGTALGAAQWGALAAAGVASVAVARRLRVLVVSTGQELTPPGEPLAPAHIHDANAVSLAVALREIGVEPTVEQVPSDEASSLIAALERHPEADLAITTGGVSAGAYEVVRDALGGRGVEFGGVAMQPGGPQGLGVARLGDRDLPIVAFPGNPVSTLVSFEVLLRPALLHRLRMPGRARRVAHLPLAASLASPPEKHQVRRGRILEDGRADLVGGPSSHLITSYARSNALVHVPAGVASLDEGDDVEVWRIDG